MSSEQEWIRLIQCNSVHRQEMREREELKKAIEQSDRLLSRVRQLEEENAGLSKEKNDTFVKMRAVSRV